jgi:hypothetical protein
MRFFHDRIYADRHTEPSTIVEVDYPVIINVTSRSRAADRVVREARFVAVPATASAADAGM